MRPTSLLLSIVSIFLLSTTSFAQEQDPFGSFGGNDPDPFKQVPEEENPFGVQPKTEKPQVEDPFAPIKKDTEVKPFDDPFTPLKKETEAKPTKPQTNENPFGIAPVDEKPETKPIVEEPKTTFQPIETKPVETNPIQTNPIQTNPIEKMEPKQETDPFNTIKEAAQPEAKIIEEPKRPAEDTFEEKFWTYLKSNAYENWAPVPNSQGDFYVGTSPHGAFLKMYLNRIAVGNPSTLPAGSIIVKENYSVDRSTLTGITVMYRSKAYNPDAGDWYWVKFNPNGTVASKSVEGTNKPISGKVSSCIDCHSGAQGDDFIFFNDK